LARTDVGRVNVAETQLGKARTAIVAQRGSAAVVTSVVAQPRKLDCSNRVRFVGPCAFEEASAAHIRDVVLAVVDCVVDMLEVPRLSFDISIANFNAATAQDLPISVVGYSSDASVFLAMLSLALGLPIRQDVLPTGSFASLDGDIALVRGMQEKLKAAVQDSSISIVLCPDTEDDESLKVLTPDEHLNIRRAIFEATQSLKVLTVQSIADLIGLASHEEERILAALRRGYCLPQNANPTLSHGMKCVWNVLARDTMERFWPTLETTVLTFNKKRLRELLDAYVHCYIQRCEYPRALGEKLANLLKSVPRPQLRTRFVFPLIDLRTCFLLSQFAREDDAFDAVTLLKAAASPGFGEDGAPKQDKRPEVADGHTLDRILSMITPEAIADQVDRPADDARASFILSSVTVESPSEFAEIATAFYAHLLRRTGDLRNPDQCRSGTPEAMALVERAFSRSGGVKDALAKARYGIQGGMKLVLDAITAQYKREATDSNLQSK